MGFNLGAFLGGAARGGSQVLDERRAQADRDKVTKEERQWQIATEARADARSRKKARAASKKEEEERAEMLALYYTQDQVEDIMNGGKAQVQYALDYAKKLPTDQDASANYRTSSMIAEVPPISGGPRGRVSPFTSRFKTTAAALEKYEGGFGEMLAINARNVLKFQGNETKLAELAAERTTIENSVKSYEAAKAKAEPDADTTDIFSGGLGATRMESIFRQTEGQALETAQLAEWDKQNKKYVLKAGSTGQIQSAILKNLQGLENSYAQFSPSMQTKIDFNRQEAVKSLRVFGASVVASGNTKKYSTVEEFQNAVATNSILPGSVIDVADGAKFFVYTGQPTIPNAVNGTMQTFFEFN
jgi:hypothetical protein